MAGWGVSEEHKERLEAAERTIKVWDIATGQEVARMSHDDAVGNVFFTPDGRRLVSSSFDLTVRLWDAGHGPRDGQGDSGRPERGNLPGRQPEGSGHFQQRKSTLACWELATSTRKKPGYNMKPR